MFRIYHFDCFTLHQQTIKHIKKWQISLKQSQKTVKLPN
jgi:hypothetical protein